MIWLCYDNTMLCYECYAMLCHMIIHDKIWYDVIWYNITHSPIETDAEPSVSFERFRRKWLHCNETSLYMVIPQGYLISASVNSVLVGSTRWLPWWGVITLGRSSIKGSEISPGTWNMLIKQLMICVHYAGNISRFNAAQIFRQQHRTLKSKSVVLLLTTNHHQ